jgi:hypothetical protein
LADLMHNATERAMRKTDIVTAEDCRLALMFHRA